MYLQANKSLFSLFLLSTLPEELFAPAAEHEAAPEGPIKRRKKRLLKPPVPVLQRNPFLYPGKEGIYKETSYSYNRHNLQYLPSSYGTKFTGPVGSVSLDLQVLHTVLAQVLVQNILQNQLRHLLYCDDTTKSPCVRPRRRRPPRRRRADPPPCIY
jgi:hypothetical protein